MTNGVRITWAKAQGIPATDYTCGYCGREVSASFGWLGRNLDHRQLTTAFRDVQAFVLAIWPRCAHPTYIKGHIQIPPVFFGDEVEHLPRDLAEPYREARDCVGGNYTAGIMIGRKLLMNVAVSKGAEANQTFAAYVTYLLDQHLITPDMQPWVDEIRELGNEANHEIPAATKEQAGDLITFLGVLLNIVYEYPGRHEAALAARAAREDQGAS
jgi:hypothetical protein